MRDCGDKAAYGVALVGESHLLAALRSLLEDGLVEVEDEHVVIDGRLFVGPLAGRARTADEDLRRYWFRMTPAGEATWRQVSEVLGAYRDGHPLKLADESQQRRTNGQRGHEASWLDLSETGSATVGGVAAALMLARSGALASTGRRARPCSARGRRERFPRKGARSGARRQVLEGERGTDDPSRACERDQPSAAQSPCKRRETATAWLRMRGSLTFG